jgi:xylan 1,4-beta-xylosidase
VMVWHYHDDDVAGPDADIKLVLTGLPDHGVTRTTHYRIDGTHSNAYGAWKAMGNPIAPNETQYARLREESKLATIRSWQVVVMPTGTAGFEFTLPRQGVSLLEFDLSAPR